MPKPFHIIETGGADDLALAQRAALDQWSATLTDKLQRMLVDGVLAVRDGRIVVDSK